MKISSISDIHIKKDGDLRSVLLKQFLNSKEVKESTHIVLLGDIFDLMVGNKNQYLLKFEHTFEAIKKASKGKKLIYISGNHDFSISEILNKYFQHQDFQYTSKALILNDKDKKIYLSHGDEVDAGELSYQRWKKLYSNDIFQKIIDSILPFSIIDKIGSKASSNSKKRSTKKFDYIMASKKYSEDVKLFVANTSADFYILGHTHIEYEDGCIVNNGFVPEHKKFAHYDGKSLGLVKLS